MQKQGAKNRSDPGKQKQEKKEKKRKEKREKRERDMGQEEMKIVIGLHRNTNELDRQTGRIAGKYGLTLSQFAVLEALYSKGDLTVGEVREKILSSVGTIPVIVNNLVGRGYVERLADQKDKRLCILHLTEEGRSVIQQAAPKNREMIREKMKELTAEEKKQLLFLLKKLGGILHE